MASYIHSYDQKTQELEATLPWHDPTTQDHLNTLNISKELIPVYVLIPLSNSEQQSLFQAVHHESGAELDEQDDEAFDHTFKLIPLHGTGITTVRQVYDHHARRRHEDNSLHTSEFIVVDQENWEDGGVLYANLGVLPDEGEKGVIMLARFDVRVVEGNAVQLLTANASWWDLCNVDIEENERFTKGHLREVIKPVPETYWAWYYLISESSAIKIHDRLEPDWHKMDAGESKLWWAGRDFPQRGDTGDLWEQIRRQHPFCCAKMDRLHRQLFIVSDNEDPDADDAIAICRVEWDGDFGDYRYFRQENWSWAKQEEDHAGIRSIMPRLEVLQRVHASDALREIERLSSMG